MKLSVTRLDDHGRYATTIVRDDGVRFVLRGPDCTFAMPHDMAHYVVERALGLDHGFWGRVAAGGVFPGMSFIDGRRKPRAAERAKALVKANPDRLSEAEVLVRIFCETIEEDHGEASSILTRRLKERRIPAGPATSRVGGAEIADIFERYRELRSRWANLPVGGSIELDW
jgi:hypothetical protein